MVNKTAIQWLYEQYRKESIPTDAIIELFREAERIEKEQKIEFACKVVEVSSEKYIQGKTTEQIAKELLTFKSE
jgi:hypothetical protein